MSTFVNSFIVYWNKKYVANPLAGQHFLFLMFGILRFLRIVYSERQSATKTDFQTGYLVREHKGFGKLPTSPKSQMGTHLLCLLPTQNKEGRERNETEAKNQRRSNRCKKSAISRIADARSYNSIW